ncbi:hypothetical protein [Paraburkholderia tropica]|uniref:DUF3150 domain-containing protein n=1 Tax=Paraburkholderia tropica TaxID=92647 RepID=A0AAQ1JXP4_9BURK|nr:hypothetical protein [Paraburkholderia tropica]RQN37237.1 hypothetical protein EHZ25_20005 [Paraburkholderia tropica]SEK13100.1 hypothetical protein SAMN05216550_12387 [Paraburkholderia tropica]
MNITDIQSRVMLCSVTISSWAARRFDEKVTEEVEKNHATKGIGRFNKRLLPEHAPSFKEVLSLGGRIRRHFYDHTLEYNQLSVRLLPTQIYMEFAEQMRRMKDEFDLAVQVFLTDYLDLKELARAEMNGLFNEADYPTLAQLGEKFGVRMSVLPFPDASQFGVDLPEDVLTSLRGEIDQHVMRSINNASQDIVHRLYDAVSAMANRLYASNNVRMDVAVNVRELCGLLPKLNFSNDPQLVHILEQAKRHLAVHTGNDLKESDVLRSQVAAKASEIEELMEAFMGGKPQVAMPKPGHAPQLRIAA